MLENAAKASKILEDGITGRYRAVSELIGDDSAAMTLAMVHGEIGRQICQEVGYQKGLSVRTGTMRMMDGGVADEGEKRNLAVTVRPDREGSVFGFVFVMTVQDGDYVFIEKIMDPEDYERVKESHPDCTFIEDFNH